MCANNAEGEVKERFHADALYVEYTDPGFILFKKLQERVQIYEEKQGESPQIIFLQNHGVFVGADSVQEIKALYEKIDQRIGLGIQGTMPSTDISEYQSPATRVITDYYKDKNLKCQAVTSDLIGHFSSSKDQYEKIARPFSPDIIVYCKSRYLFILKEWHENNIIQQLDRFKIMWGYYPKVMVEEQGGLILAEEGDTAVQTVQEVFIDLMKISFLSENFGGPHIMSPEQIEFIDNWEVEHYRRKVAKQK
jgi:rhamnose utilization protein RhaD (predicted bifunctional aldolase and dehydrogenase)